MDFFTQQDKARRFTKTLLIYLLIAVTCIVVAVNLIIYFFFKFIEGYQYVPENWFSGGLVYYVSIGTCLLILSGSLFRWMQLRKGGHAVATMMGGKLIDLNTSDYKERQFINVVEEMSIASGVPLPNIYILEHEQGINAFAAGYQPGEAIIAVTSGTIQTLNREELQGVVAHEFSHILNGDMQINIKLLAIVAGLVMISMAGRLLVPRTYYGSGMHYQRRVVRSNNKSAGAIVVLGLALQLLGFIGVFFGRLIKSAVSRQREFLADASAVQFTRNSAGIASALNQIRLAQAGSSLDSAHAEDMSHMCFAQPLNFKMISLGLSKWMATHPPLEERIQSIDPQFIERDEEKRLAEMTRQAQKKAAQFSVEESSAAMADQNTTPGAAEMLMGALPLTAQIVAETIGNIDQQHLDYAARIHESYSDDLMLAIHKAETAKVIVFLLVLANMELKTGMLAIKDSLDESSTAAIGKYKEEIFVLEKALRLPLFDLLLPALKLMSEEDKIDFIALCKVLVKSDKRYTLFEFVMLVLLEQHLVPSAGRNIKIKYHSFKSLKSELQMLLSVMVQCGGGAKEERDMLFRKAAADFPMRFVDLLDVKEISPKKISQALQHLAQLAPLLKRNVIEACADIAMEDGKLKATEAEMLRAIAESLNCPMPPLLPDAIR